MATNRTEPFGIVLKRYRGRAGLTQEALAERSGLSARAISDLERGVNRSPRADTVQLLARALQLAGDNLAAFEAAGRSMAHRLRPYALPCPSRLPIPTTALIGREREVDQLCALVRQDGARLVTLTGTGGTGKTRLAVQVATHLDDHFADGAHLVPLAAVAAPDLVLAAITRALGEPDTLSPPSLPALRAFLRDRRLLLVLDNVEHVLPAAPLVAEMLAECPATTTG